MTLQEMRLSVPAPGRTLIGVSEIWGEPVRRSIAAAATALTPATVRTVNNVFRPRDPAGVAGNAEASEAAFRAARLLLTTWLVARGVGAIDTDSPLQLGADWFCGLALGKIEMEAAFDPLGDLRHLDFGPDFADLLPYILDPSGPGTRRMVLRDASHAIDRQARKRAGVYYTPSDVAEFMVRGVHTRDMYRLIDPACGTGVFLRAALQEMRADGVEIDEALSRLYGIDISEAAVDACAMVLTFDCLSLDSRDGDGLTLWHQSRLNLLAADSLFVRFGRARPEHALRARKRAATRTSLEVLEPPVRVSPSAWLEVADAFPEVVDGFEAVVGNPPYAPLGDRNIKSLSEEWMSTEVASSATNMYAPFVEMMWRFGSPDSRASMVVPLSVAYSTMRPARALRRALQVQGGAWNVYFFDRTPGALFGDDVKQRNAILVRRSSDEFSMTVTPLMRWTSRTRTKLFADLPEVVLGHPSIADGIPKLGSSSESIAFDLLRLNPVAFADDVAKFEKTTARGAVTGSKILLIAGTAYNWLSVAPRVTALQQRGAQPSSESPVHKLTFETTEQAWAGYATLSSRLAYWLWRVSSDGFHVSRSFLEALPLSISLGDTKHLAKLGKELWARASEQPIVSINGGKQTVSYCPHVAPESLTMIDAELIRSHRLPPDFAGELEALVSATVIVDFDDPQRTGPTSRPLAAWGRS